MYKMLHISYWQTVAGGHNVCHYQSKFRKLVLQETCRLSESLVVEYILIKNYTTQPRPNDVSPGINRCGRVKLAKVFLFT